MSTLEVEFINAKSDKDIEDIFYHNISAFFDSDEFNWTVPWLKEINRDGWNIYGVHCGNEIIAAFFIKKDGDSIITKQTPVKISFQGHGISHKIKNEIESLAKNDKIKSIFNYCAIDNFRMVALNESHGYKKTGRNPENKKTLVEWQKKL